jgi:WD40 repeat protein
LSNNIVAVGRKTNIEIWSVQPKPQRILTLENAHEKDILSLVELKNGDLASASTENYVKIWSKCSDFYD